MSEPLPKGDYYNVITPAMLAWQRARNHESVASIVEAIRESQHAFDRVFSDTVWPERDERYESAVEAIRTSDTSDRPRIAETLVDDLYEHTSDIPITP